MPPAPSSPQPALVGRSPGGFVFGALLLTLGVTVVLALDALATARRHRAAAQAVLRDYAGFAAAELESRLQSALAQRFFPLLSLLAARGATNPGTPLPLPAALTAGADTALWRAAGAELAFFRKHGDDPLETKGATLPEPVRARLADSAPARARGLLATRAYLAVLALPSSQGGRIAVLAAGRDTTPAGPSLYGILLSAGPLQALLPAALARAPLLPPSLTGGTRLDSAVAYRILRPDGSVFLEAGGAPSSPFTATRTLDPVWGGFRTEATLRPSLASRLIIGGVPASRLPLVLALLGVATLLVVTATVQLRREREVARLREEFVAGASHELRTPLAQIRLFTETLRFGRVRNESERERSFEIIDRETRRLGNLVENLLYVSRAGQGTLSISRRELDLAGELRDAVESFAPIAAARGAKLALEAPAELEARADGDAFRQIVLNLLDNAVKYGPPGQTVRVGLETVDGRSRLTVDDQGPGIPERERARVFERFVRLERERRMNTTGTGLGLALVSSLAALHGGRAWADAAPGGGARLVVELGHAEA